MAPIDWIIIGIAVGLPLASAIYFMLKNDKHV